MIVLVPSTNTFECAIHTFTVITPEYRFISPYSKMEGKCVLFFKIQQTGLKPCCECILYCMRKDGCFELPFPFNPSKHTNIRLLAKTSLEVINIYKNVFLKEPTSLQHA